MNDARDDSGSSSTESASKASGEGSVPTRTKRLLLVTAAGVVALTIPLVLYLSGSGKAGDSGSQLVPGADYCIVVTSAWIAPLDNKGKAWDSDGSGPDVYYELCWQNNRVFQSAVDPDTLVPHWKTKEPGVSLGQKSTVKVEALRLGACVKYAAAEKVIIRFKDKDFLGSDQIGDISIPLGSLKQGTNVLPGAEGVKEFTLEVIPMMEDKP